VQKGLQRRPTPLLPPRRDELLGKQFAYGSFACAHEAGQNNISLIAVLHKVYPMHA
jgi:hypothetical protein